MHTQLRNDGEQRDTGDEEATPRPAGWDGDRGGKVRSINKPTTAPESPEPPRPSAVPARPILRRRPRALVGLSEREQGRRHLRRAEITSQLPFDEAVIVSRQQELDTVLRAGGERTIAFYSSGYRHFTIPDEHKCTALSLVTLGQASIGCAGADELYCFDASEARVGAFGTLETYDEAAAILYGTGIADAHGQSAIWSEFDRAHVRLYDDACARLDSGGTAVARNRSQVEVARGGLVLLHDESRVSQASGGARVACLCRGGGLAQRLLHYDDSVEVAALPIDADPPAPYFDLKTQRFELSDVSWRLAIEVLG